jgi:hypothetical protein
MTAMVAELKETVIMTDDKHDKWFLDESPTLNGAIGGTIVINDEDLKRFHDWLLAKGEQPSVLLVLRWIAEFELYAEDDEEEFIEFKAFAQQRSKYDPAAAAALSFITEFEETVEPDPMLKRLRNWLQLKGNDPTAVLARWWLAEFEEAQEQD